MSSQPLRLIGYVRVSKPDEEPQNQEYNILKYATQHGYQVIDIIVDVESGATKISERQGGQKLIDYLNDPNIDGVIVYALDRIARSLTELYKFVQLIEDKNKILISIRESWLNTLDPSIRKLIISILGWVAEFERRLISERTKAALERLKRMGKPIGRPSKFTPSLKKRMLELLKEGRTIKEVAAILGIGYSTAKKYIRYDRELRLAYLKGRYKVYGLD